jgi:hypothetical protein
MTQLPLFPDYKPLSLDDIEPVRNFLWRYQPQTSELTFTNLFIWRSKYDWRWSVEKDWLLLLGSEGNGDQFLLPPVGPKPRLEVVDRMLRWFRDHKGAVRPRIERGDERLASEISGSALLTIEPSREHFDYVYRSEDLIHLRGSRYHAKRNHISRFLRSSEFELVPISEDILAACAEFQERWCEWRRCEDDMNLLGEWEAIKVALAHYTDLNVQGAAIMIDTKVEAFTFGERLNEDTAVIHIEKANPEIPGLYAVINQKYCEKYWSDVTYINREQDLGEEGLRKAKLSYHPDHLVQKFRITLSA